MAQTKAPTPLDFAHDPDCEVHACQCAVREVGWVARQARTMTVADLDGPRGQEFFARKRALLTYIEATR